ncbi:ubiquitin-like protein [Laetiporus sulphureus 93-53]|uniref:Ubiquitin-like protein n=1 Tax=Laetiporus sulphureus 93-53 TaxID=1314785 RepID=A0A165BZT9_9APHY|nr:ubiquitin-like protein [Laetiporus sulphureus 93-53]KZT01946.1 ubiquitin-like protein [Laetiporus sulphureus 93-53]
MEAPEGEDLKPKINITINFDGQVCTVKVKPGMPFKKIFDAAESRFNREPGTLKYTFDGQRLRPEQCPAELDMEDGDVIDAHLPQMGGAALAPLSRQRRRPAYHF